MDGEFEDESKTVIMSADKDEGKATDIVIDGESKKNEDQFKYVA